MTTFTIALPNEHVRTLKQQAEQAGVTPEELLRQSVEAWLAARSTKPGFAEAATYVLQKNTELYRRLS